MLHFKSCLFIHKNLAKSNWNSACTFLCDSQYQVGISPVPRQTVRLLSLNQLSTFNLCAFSVMKYF